MSDPLPRRLKQTGSALAVVAWSLCWSPAAQGDAGPDSSAAREAPRPPLAPLPKAPGIEFEKPLEEETTEVSELLDRFSSEQADERSKAVTELPSVLPRWIPALSIAVDRIADEADRSKMRALLDDLRSRARNAERKQMRAAGEKGKVTTPDLLDVATGEFARPSDPTWKSLTQVLAVSRLLTELGTVDAVRTLIRLRVRFGETLRIDTQLQLAKLGDRSVAALVETRRHKAPKIARWAERQLDELGKAIPSEAVKSPDPQVLADVLRAFGRIRDPDAARIIVSFANSEHAQTREAARQAVVLLGEVSNWSLRDMYKNIMGKTPPRDWSWERSARELFSEFDRLRLAAVYRLFDQGISAASSGQHERAKEAFDKVLARSPLFERRGEMAASYLAHAKQVFDDDRPSARASLRRATRLSEDPAQKAQISSLALTAEGLDLLDRGLADQVLFRRALDADKSNARAADALARIRRGEAKKEESLNRYIAALAIGIGALLALALIGFRRGKPTPADDVDPSAPRSLPGEGAQEPSEPEVDGEADVESSPEPALEPDRASEPQPVVAHELSSEAPQVSLPPPTEEAQDEPAEAPEAPEPDPTPGAPNGPEESASTAPAPPEPVASSEPTRASDEPPALALPTLVLPQPEGLPELPRTTEAPSEPAKPATAPEVHLPAPAPSGPLATPSISLPPLADDD